MKETDGEATDMGEREGSVIELPFSQPLRRCGQLILRAYSALAGSRAKRRRLLRDSKAALLVVLDQKVDKRIVINFVNIFKTFFDEFKKKKKLKKNGIF